MSKRISLHALGLTASVALALGMASNVAAQEQSSSDEQSQSQQNNEQRKDQNKDAKEQEDKHRDDEQKNSQQRKDAKDNKDAERSKAQKDQRTDQQQMQRQREQQERQRRDQNRQRDENRTSQNRDRSARDNSDNAWPQPNGRDYASDSLSYDSDGNSDRSQQGGLGVNLVSDGRGGVVVSRVHQGSPAAKMGIRERDRITQVNGREVQSVQQFIARVRNMQPGEEIELDIRRAAGDERRVSGELESRNEALAERGGRGEQVWSNQRGSQSMQRNRDNSQAGYNESRDSWTRQQGRSTQFSSNRIDQMEQQIDQLSRQIDQLRASLQTMRRQASDSNSSQYGGEQTASYNEEQRSTTSRSTNRNSDWNDEGSNQYRQADRRGQRSDSYNEGPGGEIGEDRLHVDSQDIDRD